MTLREAALLDEPNILISEDYIYYASKQDLEDGRGYRSGDSGVYETFTNSRKRLFKSLQREYGACISKVYIGEGTPVGWTFRKKQEDGSYQETWITLHEAKPDTVTTYHYATL